MLTEICLTVDTEFSIAGAFADPQRFSPRGETNVYCPVDGCSEGMGFILRTLKQFDYQATFFVETLNTHYFGEQPMGRIVEDLLRHGQDVQIHLHPCWLTFRHPEWANRLQIDPPNDDCSLRSIDEMIEYISLGSDFLHSWGAARPVALRTGNLIAAMSIYQAMQQCGIQLSSNIAVGHKPPEDKKLCFNSGRHIVAGVLEVPATSYIEYSLGSHKKLRMLSITATSSTEMESLLLAAHHSGVSQLVIVTHPFEFAKEVNNGASWVKNRVNQRRLQKLCEFIDEHNECFKMSTFGKDGKRWLQQGSEKESSLSAPLLPVLARIFENKMNSSLLAY